MHYDMEDLLEQANEIQESLGRSYAVPDEIDEADLEAGTCRCHAITKRLVEGHH
jgi:charged multivesicular body protein 5